MAKRITSYGARKGATNKPLNVSGATHRRIKALAREMDVPISYLTEQILERALANVKTQPKREFLNARRRSAQVFIESLL